jgi:hypothetical protein
VLRLRGIIALISTVALGTACANGMQGASAGEYIDPAEAAKTVVLHVNNVNQLPMELRVIQNGQSRYIGSVGGGDSTDILLDPQLFPTASLYVTAIPPDGRSRALAGPIAASKGDQINFTVQVTLNMSRAFVVH